MACDNNPIIISGRNDIIDHNRNERWRGLIYHSGSLIYLQLVVQMALTDLMPGTKIPFVAAALFKLSDLIEHPFAYFLTFGHVLPFAANYF